MYGLVCDKVQESNQFSFEYYERGKLSNCRAYQVMYFQFYPPFHIICLFHLSQFHLIQHDAVCSCDDRHAHEKKLSLVYSQKMYEYAYDEYPQKENDFS